MNPTTRASRWRRLLKYSLGTGSQRGLKNNNMYNGKNHFIVKRQAGSRKLVDSIRNINDQEQEGERLNCIAAQPSTVNVFHGKCFVFITLNFNTPVVTTRT